VLQALLLGMDVGMQFHAMPSKADGSCYRGNDTRLAS
jgi:hypothetical protein